MTRPHTPASALAAVQAALVAGTTEASLSMVFVDGPGAHPWMAAFEDLGVEVLGRGSDPTSALIALATNLDR